MEVQRPSCKPVQQDELKCPALLRLGKLAAVESQQELAKIAGEGRQRNLNWALEPIP